MAGIASRFGVGNPNGVMQKGVLHSFCLFPHPIFSEYTWKGEACAPHISVQCLTEVSIGAKKHKHSAQASDM